MNELLLKADKLSKHLFWDVEPDKLNFESDMSFIIARVLEYGVFEDWKKIYTYYGIDKIAKNVINLRNLDDRSTSFISLIAGIPKEKFFMLYYETIDSKTLELLKSIQTIPEFSHFVLLEEHH